MFGNHLQGLSATAIKDYGAGSEVPLTDYWELGLTRVEDLLTVVVYVANVRTQEDVVWQHSEEATTRSILDLDLKGTPNEEVERSIE